MYVLHVKRFRRKLSLIPHTLHILTSVVGPLADGRVDHVTQPGKAGLSYHGRSGVVAVDSSVDVGIDGGGEAGVVALDGFSPGVGGDPPQPHDPCVTNRDRCAPTPLSPHSALSSLHREKQTK